MKKEFQEFVDIHPNNWSAILIIGKKEDIKNKLNWLLEQTSFLPENSPLKQRWWHILNGNDIPKCSYCNLNHVIIKNI